MPRQRRCKSPVVIRISPTLRRPAAGRRRLLLAWVNVDDQRAGRAANVAVSGGGKSRVFDMTAGQNVTISGLTITRGFAFDQGGGILNQGSNLTSGQ